jgi:hypothetical protein
MTELHLIDVEGELGVVLPADVLSKLGAAVGEDLVLSETPAGYLLTSATPAPEPRTEHVAA